MESFVVETLKKIMPRKALILGGELLDRVRPDPHVERFVEHNRKVWRPESRKKRDGVILFDVFPPAQSLITFSYFLNILGDHLNADFRPFSYNGLNNPRSRKLYSSFGAGPEVVTRLTSQEMKAEAEKIADGIFSRLETKQDVFDIKIHDLPIGIDIYESYLRFHGQPTVYIDEELRKVIRETAEFVLFWEDFLKKHDVRALVVSHCCYAHLNVPIKLAFREKIPVYSPYAQGMYKLTRPFESYAYFPNFRKMFANLPKGEQDAGMKLAERQITRRLSGEVGVDMPYSSKSGFQKKSGAPRVLADNKKIKVLIASHCFYDNPYAFGDLLFVDFYEWVSFLGKLAEETDYEWYLKMHPDPFPGTEDTMRELLAKYPRIRMLPKETSHLQMVEEGLQFVLTAYGSVGHEYPALGVQVINAGYNPRESYTFNWQPKTVAEYREMLLNLDKLNLKVDMQELYEFYFMYHYYIYADDLVFPSFRKAREELGGPRFLSQSQTYSYFLDHYSEQRHSKILSDMKNFIVSGKPYFFSKGAEG